MREVGPCLWNACAYFWSGIVVRCLRRMSMPLVEHGPSVNGVAKSQFNSEPRTDMTEVAVGCANSHYGL